MNRITLKAPVWFGCGQDDPAGVVFAFGARNGNDHLALLRDLARLLTTEENVECIIKETDKDKIDERILKI